MERWTVVGRLVALWRWCLDDALDGVLSEDVDADALDALFTAGSLGVPSDVYGTRHLHFHVWEECAPQTSADTDNLIDNDPDGVWDEGEE